MFTSKRNVSQLELDKHQSMSCLQRTEKMYRIRPLKLNFLLGFFLIYVSSGLPTGTTSEKENPDSNPDEDTRAISISQGKCREYGKLSHPDLEFSFDLHGEVDECTITENSTQSGEAYFGEVPHMAIIGYMRDGEMEYICEGSLISDTHVVTAAYCGLEIEKNGNCFVRFGGLHLKNVTADGEIQLIRVSQTTLHPQFVVGEYYNDISLLRLGRPVKLSPNIRPICLHIGKPVNRIPLVASGWGVGLVTRVRNELLRKVKLFETPYEVCKVPYDLKKNFGTSFRKGLDNATMICATHPLRNDSLCLGGGGGPLYSVSPDTYCTYQLVGIVGFGGVCRKIQDVPSVFTRIATYVPWIESVVWPQKTSAYVEPL